MRIAPIMHLKEHTKPVSITIGADPEFILMTAPVPKSTSKLSFNNYEPRPITGLLGGTKAKPIAVHPDYPSYMMQEDNVMAELNVPAASSGKELFRSVELGKKLMLNNIIPKLQGYHVGWSSSCVGRFPVDALKTPGAQRFGCDPDFDAYNDGAKCDPVVMAKGDKYEERYAGGHIHVGWSELPSIPSNVLAMFVEAYAYLPYLMYDQQGGRRATYGAAGRYRPKPYGIEYRTPSNFWTYDRNLGTGLLDAILCAARGLAYLDQDYLIHAYNTIPWEDIKTAINTSNTTDASTLYSYIDNEFPIGVRG